MFIWIRRLIYTALIIYVVIAAILFFAQRKFLYFPPNFYHPPPAGWTEVQTPNGILGWHSPSQDGKATIMVFHGNGSAIDSNLHIFRDLQNQGYGVWSVGYPGYPGNSGRPTQTALIAAAEEQYNALKESGTENIIFYGTSLGSAVAAQLSTRTDPKLLILDAPFNSISDMARRQMPFLPTSLLLKDKWRSDHAFKGQSVPLIWIHGTADQIVPIAQGQKLFDSYTGPKSSHTILGAHHTNTWRSGGKIIVLEALKAL